MLILQTVNYEETQYTYLGFMIEQPRPGYFLLVAAAKRVSPVLSSIPATFPFNDVIHLHD